MLTTQKILINIVRFLKFIQEKLNTIGILVIATENDYLKFIIENIPELRHILDYRRIYLNKSNNDEDNLQLPICLFQEYLCNGIRFLSYINKIDGVYSTTRKSVVEKTVK